VYGYSITALVVMQLIVLYLAQCLKSSLVRA